MPLIFYDIANIFVILIRKLNFTYVFFLSVLIKSTIFSPRVVMNVIPGSNLKIERSRLPIIIITNCSTQH